MFDFKIGEDKWHYSNYILSLLSVAGKVLNASPYRAGCRTQYFVKVNVDFSRRGQ